MLPILRHIPVLLYTVLSFSILSTEASVPRSDLVAEYLFEDTSNLGLDTSGNGAHAKVPGSPSSIAGKVGQSLVIDELSDVLTDIPGFTRGQSTTFNLWFKTSKGGYLMQQEYWTGGSTWAYFPAVRGDNGLLQPYVVAFSPRDDLAITSAGYDYRDNQWHMLTFISDGHSGKAYVDGQLIGSDASSTGPSTWTKGQASSMTKLGGACTYGFNGCAQGSGFFDGLIDNVRVYNRELNLSEIQQLQQETFVVPNTPPVASADNYYLANTGDVISLHVLKNDSDDDLPTVNIRITGQSNNGGSAIVSSQTLQYTPQAGYIGEDWIEYQLVDKQGATSATVRVSLTLWSRVNNQIPEAGLIAEYLFEDSINPEKDTSSQQNHARKAGTPTLETGKIGQAVLMNEVSDVLTNIPGFTRGQSTTFNLWFKTTTGGYLMQQEYWTGSSTWAYFPKVASDNGVLSPWVVAFSPRNDLEISKTDYDYRDNQWHMLTFISDGHSGKAYVDGQLIGSDNSSSGPSTWTKGQVSSMTKLGGACIYGYNGCTQGNEFFNGLLDNVRIYNRELNLEEITRLYNELPAGQNQPPVASTDSYKVVENDGIATFDLLTNDWDEDKSSLNISIVSQNSAAGTAVVVDQTLRYTPLAGFDGQDWIEYQLTDNNGLTSAVSRVTLTLWSYVPAGIPETNLTAEYRFEDPSQPGKDSTLNFNHAKSSGSPTLAAGKIGQALVVNKLSDVLTDIPGFTRGQSTTFNLWFKTTTGGYLMQQEYWTGNSTWAYLPKVGLSNGRLSPWVIAFHPRNDLEISKTDYDYRDNQWHMLTFISDGHSGKAYVDGQLIGEDNSSSGPSTWTKGQVSSMTKLGGACIYGYNGCTQGNEFFKGLLDNMRIYSRELNLTEIRQLYRDSSILSKRAPVATADSFDVINRQSSTVGILSNDIDEALNTITIQVTSQKPNGGTVTITGQTVTYQPEVGFTGEDWFDYQLTDETGLKSNIVRVSINVSHPPLAASIISPRYNFIYASDGAIEVTLATHETGAKIEYEVDTTRLTNNQSSGKKIYTGPFIVDTSSRIGFRTKKVGYPDSNLVTHDYIFCTETSVCQSNPTQAAAQKTLEWSAPQVRVGDNVELSWWFTTVGYCYESTTGFIEKSHKSSLNASQDRENKGTAVRRFTSYGQKKSRWYFNDWATGPQYRVIPKTGELSIDIEVTPLDKPTLVERKLGYDDDTNRTLLDVKWAPVAGASHYQLKYQKQNGPWQSVSVNGTKHILSLEKGKYHFALSGCIPEGCEQVGRETLFSSDINDTPINVKQFEWLPAAVVVGQVAVLHWDMENTLGCVDSQGASIANKGSAAPIRFYQQGTHGAKLTCRSQKGKNTEITLPVDKHLKVNKLLAPANLGSQQ